jgi:hypothetical protein
VEAFARFYADIMLVEGTLRWQVTEDCPWDLLLALALRELGHISDASEPAVPRVVPAPAYATLSGATSYPMVLKSHVVPDPEVLRDQWRAWWERILLREVRRSLPQVAPPHFSAFDREVELQDLAAEYFGEAAQWATDRSEEYAQELGSVHEKRVADVVEVVQRREHELRRQAAHFRLDVNVLPLARPGAWIVAPHTIVVSWSFREDSRAFRAWLEPIVAALV